MAKITLSKNCGIGGESCFVSADLDGTDEFCRESARAIIEAFRAKPENQMPSAKPQPRKIAAPTPTADCLTFAQQPPVYDLTLEDGEQVQLMEVERFVNVNTKTGKTTSLALCIFVDCLADEYRMNSTDTTEGGWEAAELREKLNGEILARLPKNLRDNMVAFENGDLLRLPTQEEIFGDENGGGQFECMKLRRNRMAFQGKNGLWECFWLSSVAISTNFCPAHSSGDANYWSASHVIGVRPLLQIKLREAE